MAHSGAGQRARRPLAVALAGVLALAGCSTATSPGGDGITLEDYCRTTMVYDVEAATSGDGVTLTWRDGVARSTPTTYTVLRRSVGAPDDAWTVVDAITLDDPDERRFVDPDPQEDAAPTTAVAVEYAVTVDDPNCGPSPLCPEGANACASVQLLAPAPTPTPSPHHTSSPPRASP